MFNFSMMFVEADADFMREGRKTFTTAAVSSIRSRAPLDNPLVTGAFVMLSSKNVGA